MADSSLDRAKPVLNVLLASGYDAYIVGGAVRDSLLHKEINDVDIATSARPEKVLSLFDETVPLGLQHGTVLVIFEGIPFEVTTFRSEEGYSDFRHPDQVTFVASIEKDLERRDFTINAMALDVNSNLIDPFNGREDLNKRCLKTVGDAVARFREDPLRMLRAARFISQLDFRASEELEQAVQKERAKLKFISIERIRDELIKSLKGEVPYKGLEFLVSTGLSDYITGLEGLKNSLESTCSVNFHALKKDEERWGLLFYLLKNENVPDLLKVFRFSSKMAKAITALLSFFKSEHHVSLTAAALYHEGLDTCLSAERLNEALGEEPRYEKLKELKSHLPIQSRKDLNVNGQELMTWVGQPAGPWIAALLSELENRIVAGNLENLKDPIQRWVQTEWMTRK